MICADPALNNCACGSDAIVRWAPQNPEQGNRMGLESIEKIECSECKRVVWGGDDDAASQWNRQDYDDEPKGAV